MYKGNSTRIFPIVLVLVIIVIVVMTLVAIGRALFGTGQADQGSGVSSSSLLSTDVSSSVRMTIRGPIVANEDFRTSQVTISPTARSAHLFSGYTGQGAGSELYDNTPKAYEEFVYAIDRTNLMNGIQLKGDEDDARGICPTGQLYEFEIFAGQMVTKHLWTSTCKGYKGSLKGSVTQVKGLFLKQVPHDSQILKKIDL